MASISTGLAKWLEDFLCTLNGSENEKLEVVSEINVKDLPKVIWNEETFYILFDQESGKAKVLNEFANEITCLNATTIEEVDKLLNSNTVISSNEFENELKNIESNFSEDKTAEEQTNVEQDTIPDQQTPVQEQTPETETQDSQYQELTSKIASLEKQITALVEQQKAYTTYFDNLDLDSQNKEIEHFTETAVQTEEEINKEKEIDITTPGGRTDLVNLKNEIEDQFNNNDINVEEVEIQPEQQEQSEETEKTVEQPEENYEQTEVVDEIPTEEPTIEDVPVEDEQSEELETKEETENEVKIPKEFEELDITKNQKTYEEKNEDESKLDEYSEASLLNERDTNIFKNAICPNCGNKLYKSEKINNLQGIKCESCKKEYAVDLRTEKIYTNK